MSANLQRVELNFSTVGGFFLCDLTAFKIATSSLLGERWARRDVDVVLFQQLEVICILTGGLDAVTGEAIFNDSRRF
jgi:hypothetical protein